MTFCEYKRGVHSTLRDTLTKEVAMKRVTIDGFLPEYATFKETRDVW